MYWCESWTIKKAGLVVFPIFFKSEFGIKEFMIWATVSSQSCFCWLYRPSPSLVAKNIMNLISVLTIWWCPCVEASLCCWKRVFAMTSAFSWQNSINLCLASFRIPRPNLPVTPGVSWLPTFAFQSPIMKRTSYLGVNVILNGLPWKRTEIILSFLRLHPGTAFQTLLLTMMAIPFLLRDSCLQ